MECKQGIFLALFWACSKLHLLGSDLNPCFSQSGRILRICLFPKLIRKDFVTWRHIFCHVPSFNSAWSEKMSGRVSIDALESINLSSVVGVTVLSLQVSNATLDHQQCPLFGSPCSWEVVVLWASEGPVPHYLQTKVSGSRRLGFEWPISLFKSVGSDVLQSTKEL